MQKRWLTLGIALLIVTVAAVSMTRSGASAESELSEASREFAQEYMGTPFNIQREVIEKYLPTVSYRQMLEALEAANPACHTDGHQIGEALYRDADNLRGTLEVCGNLCSDGCFHGAMISMLSSDSEMLGEGVDIYGAHLDVLGDVLAVAQEICYGPDVRNIIVPLECIHGLGHTVAYLTGDDLEKSIALCRQFDTEKKRRACAGGVFMEYAYTGKHDDILHADPYHPCDEFSDFKPDCYRFKGKFMVRSLESNGAVAACRALEREESLACFGGLGAAWSSIERLSTEAGLRSVCVFTDSEARAACINAAVKEVVFTSDYSKDVCVDLAPSVRDYCSAVRESMLDLG